MATRSGAGNHIGIPAGSAHVVPKLAVGVLAEVYGIDHLRIVGFLAASDEVDVECLKIVELRHGSDRLRHG